MQMMYRVRYLVRQYGLVDFDSGCFTLCLFLLGLFGNLIGSKGLASGQYGGTSQIKVNPTQLSNQMPHPVLLVKTQDTNPNRGNIVPF